MKLCALCQKGSKMGGKRSLLRGHYNPSQRLRKYPNLQWATLPADLSAKALASTEALAKAGINAGKRAKVCTRCIKKLHK